MAKQLYEGEKIEEYAGAKWLAIVWDETMNDLAYNLVRARDLGCIGILYLNEDTRQPDTIVVTVDQLRDLASALDDEYGDWTIGEFKDGFPDEEAE